MKIRIPRYHWIAWVIILSGVSLGIWVFLRLFGVINSPLIFELFPYISGFLTLIAVGVSLGIMVDQFKQVKRDIRYIKADIRDMKKDIHFLRTDLTVLTAEFKMHVRECHV